MSKNNPNVIDLESMEGIGMNLICINAITNRTKLRISCAFVKGELIISKKD